MRDGAGRNATFPGLIDQEYGTACAPGATVVADSTAGWGCMVTLFRADGTEDMGGSGALVAVAHLGACRASPSGG
jgi:hypothetical protein